MIQTLTIIIFVALGFTVLQACNKSNEDTPTSTERVVNDSPYIKTSREKYPAIDSQKSPELENGLHGLVKLFVEHKITGKTLKDKDTSGSYIAKGTGGVIVHDGRWFIITARHVLVPNKDIKQFTDPEEPDEVIELKSTTSLGTRIVIGSASAKPSRIWFSMVHDIAILEVAGETRFALAAVLHKDAKAPISIKPNNELIEAGAEVEAWGFPAKHHPQVEKPSISSVTPKYFVLNRALLRGFSGGLVLRETQLGGDVAKTPLGIISRADDQANQTTVLDWGIAKHIFDAAVSGKELAGLVAVSVPGKTKVDGLDFSVSGIR